MKNEEYRSYRKLNRNNRKGLVAIFTLISSYMFTQNKVEGLLKDNTTNEPIVGANVFIKATKEFVTTDSVGRFTLTTNIKFPFTLSIQYTGYKNTEIDVYEALEEPLDIKLKIGGLLNEVVVVGYGTQKREEVVGAISTIDPSTTKTIPEAGFDSQLAGKAAGVQIANNTGVPGSDVFIRIRGTTSINAGNDPLYVIDGVFVNNSSLQNIAQDRGTSPLTDINPADIESIEILKDASAVAIYGSRGANGVVIVTTKRGNYEQKSKIEFSASEGQAWAP